MTGSNEDAYLFPDRELLGMDNGALRRVISRNLRQANDQTDGSDMDSDVKIDYVQDIIEQARDILVGRGETFSDEEKESMEFLDWPLTEEQKAEKALADAREREAHRRFMEEWDRTIQHYTRWLVPLVHGEHPSPEVDFSGLTVHIGVSSLSSGETRYPCWQQVLLMKEELERIAGMEIQAGYTGFEKDKESGKSCFWSFRFQPPVWPVPCLAAWPLGRKSQAARAYWTGSVRMSPAASHSRRESTMAALPAAAATRSARAS